MSKCENCILGIQISDGCGCCQNQSSCYIRKDTRYGGAYEEDAHLSHRANVGDSLYGEECWFKFCPECGHKIKNKEIENDNEGCN